MLTLSQSGLLKLGGSCMCTRMPNYGHCPMKHIVPVIPSYNLKLIKAVELNHGCVEAFIVKLWDVAHSLDILSDKKSVTSKFNMILYPGYSKMVTFTEGSNFCTTMVHAERYQTADLESSCTTKWRIYCSCHIWRMHTHFPQIRPPNGGSMPANVSEQNGTFPMYTHLSNLSGD